MLVVENLNSVFTEPKQLVYTAYTEYTKYGTIYTAVIINMYIMFDGRVAMRLANTTVDMTMLASANRIAAPISLT